MTTYHVTIFGLNLIINPVAFRVGSYPVYWYGIIIALGFALAVVYAYFNVKRFDINLDRLFDVVLVTTPLAILCARAYYLLFDPAGNGITSIGQFFGVGQPGGFQGLAIYGGVIGAAVIGVIMCKLRKVNVFSTLDIASIGFLIGQGIGRWGNFMNQEAFGAPTGSTWWGMTSENVAAELGEGALAHPCFLYESIWCLLGVLVLHLISKKRQYNGQIALSYCIWYGFGRMIIEGLRTDSLYLWGTNIRVSQALSALLVLGGIIGMVIMELRRRRLVKDSEYENMFGELEEAEISARPEENEEQADA